MTTFNGFWDRLKRANKPLSKAEDSVKITIAVSELRRLMEKAFDDGAKSRPETPSLFQDIFGK